MKRIFGDIGGARRFWTTIYVEPRDLWRGLFWDVRTIRSEVPEALRQYPWEKRYRVLCLWFCVVPMLVFRLQVVLREVEGEE